MLETPALVQSDHGVRFRPVPIEFWKAPSDRIDVALAGIEESTKKAAPMAMLDFRR
jgi:hypothetical protein